MKGARRAQPLGPEDYRRWRASTVGAITERLERARVLELVGDVRGARVLDVGCGDGELALELARRGAEVAAIDASEAMIDAARAAAARARLDVDFRVATAEQMPFPPVHFDVVVAVTILCFIDDARPVFDQIARILRPGGRLVIGELGKWSTWAAVRRMRAWRGDELWSRARFRRVRDLRRLVEGAGLTVDRVRGAIYFPRSSIAARLLGRWDDVPARLTTFGAAFLAVRAKKPSS